MVFHQESGYQQEPCEILERLQCSQRGIFSCCHASCWVSPICGEIYGELAVSVKRNTSLLEQGIVNKISWELPGQQRTLLTLSRCDGCQSPDRSVLTIIDASIHQPSLIRPDVMIRQLCDLMNGADQEFAILHAVEELNDEFRLLKTHHPDCADSNPKKEIAEYMERLLAEQAQRRQPQS